MKIKKADSTGFQFIAAFIVVIIFAVIYLVWLKDFRIFAEKLEDYEICRFSNIENAKLKLKISNQVITERKGNKCKTEYIDISKGKELDMIAKKMAACWDMYLEGKEDLFETEDANYCAFCSVLTFEDKKQLSGLTKYLIDKEASDVTDVRQSRKKYYQYMTRIIVTKDFLQEVENSHLNDLHVIDTSKPLAVIFTTSKIVNPGSLTGQSKLVSGVIGHAAGAVVSLPVLIGVGACSIGTLGTGIAICTAGAFAISLATGNIGYMMGSNYNPDRDTKILLWSYTKEDLEQLKCTKLEGKDRLDIKRY